MRLVLLAALFIFCNQVCFIYAVDKTSAATVTLFLGSTPIFIGILASVIGLERMGRGFWIATIVSLIGVGFVASGSGGFSGRLIGDGLAVAHCRDVGRVLGPITPLDAALLAVPDQFARAGLRLDPARARRPAADREPDLSVRHADVDLPGVRSDRPAVSDEHPLVHRDQPSRSVARFALLEHAAALRRPLRAAAPGRAPELAGRWSAGSRSSVLCSSSGHDGRCPSHRAIDRTPQPTWQQGLPQRQG